MYASIPVREWNAGAEVGLQRGLPSHPTPVWGLTLGLWDAHMLQWVCSLNGVRSG